MGSTIINGIRSSDVIDICNTYLKARQLGILAPNQSKLAEQSEIFISASAKSGIDAVIDEVTGYQYFRKADELQSKLDTYIQDGYREWTRTFPKEFSCIFTDLRAMLSLWTKNIILKDLVNM